MIQHGQHPALGWHTPKAQAWQGVGSPVKSSQSQPCFQCFELLRWCGPVVQPCKQTHSSDSDGDRTVGRRGAQHRCRLLLAPPHTPAAQAPYLNRISMLSFRASLHILHRFPEFRPLHPFLCTLARRQSRVSCCVRGGAAGEADDCVRCLAAVSFTVPHHVFYKFTPGGPI